MNLSWHGKQVLNSSYNQQSYNQIDSNEQSNRNHVNQRRMSLNQTPSFKHHYNDNELINQQYIENDIGPKSTRSSSRYGDETNKNNYFEQFKQIMREYPYCVNVTATDYFQKYEKSQNNTFMQNRINSSNQSQNVPNRNELILNNNPINEQYDNNLMTQLDKNIQIQNKIQHNQLKSTNYYGKNRENQSNLRNLLLKNQQQIESQNNQQSKIDDTLKMPRLTSELSLDKSNYAQSNQQLEIIKDSAPSKIIDQQMQEYHQNQIKIPELNYKQQETEQGKDIQNITNDGRKKISITRQTSPQQRVSNSKRYHLRCISSSFNFDPRLEKKSNSNKSSPIKNKRILAFKQNQIQIQEKINMSETKINDSEKKIIQLENRINFLENKMNETQKQNIDQEDLIQQIDEQDDKIDQSYNKRNQTNSSVHQTKRQKEKEKHEHKTKDEMVEDIFKDIKFGQQDKNQSNMKIKNDDREHKDLDQKQNYELDRFIARVQKQIGELSYSESIQKFYDFESKYQKNLLLLESQPPTTTQTQQDTRRLLLNKQNSKASTLQNSTRQSKNNIDQVSNKNPSIISNTQQRQVNTQKSQK